MGAFFLLLRCGYWGGTRSSVPDRASVVRRLDGGNPVVRPPGWIVMAWPHLVAEEVRSPADWMGGWEGARSFAKRRRKGSSISSHLISFHLSFHRQSIANRSISSHLKLANQSINRSHPASTIIEIKLTSNPPIANGWTLPPGRPTRNLAVCSVITPFVTIYPLQKMQGQ